MNETIALIVCTVASREKQFAKCLATHHAAGDHCGVTLTERTLRDFDTQRNLAHVVEIRNRAMDLCQERWAFLCDDDDFVFRSHVGVLVASRANNPRATVIMAQACKADKTPMGFTLSCSLVNVDRFRMVNWLCPAEGGEDFYTLSTLAARGHQIVREPAVTWQVCNDVPSMTRESRVELQADACQSYHLVPLTVTHGDLRVLCVRKRGHGELHAGYDANGSKIEWEEGMIVNPFHDWRGCSIPPNGYMCTRKKGHEGPCAAVPFEQFDSNGHPV